MRQITAAEVKPGMEVQFDLSGWDVKGTVGSAAVSPHAVWIYTEERCEMSLELDSPVTVLSEPAPVQPEEPTEFGARVVADGHEFLLSHGGRRSWKARLDGKRYAWTDLCDMGSVVVIDATPSWTVPEQATEAPGVPERIEKWPEDDSALRKYKWVDRDADTWTWTEAQAKWECRNQRGECYMARSCPSSWFGPWTRATDA